VSVPDVVFVTHVDAEVIFAVKVMSPALNMNPPPADPPVAIVVIVVQMNVTFIVIDVLPFATNTSDGSRLANVSHEPEPLAALFHRFTELILTLEF